MSARTSNLTIAKRYASAAFALAVEAKKEAVLVDEMNVLAAAIEGSAPLAESLANPLITRGTKGEILAALVTKGGALTQKTVATIAEGGRAADIPAIARALQTMLDEARGELVAEITSARPLSDAAQKKLAASLEEATGKKLKLKLSNDARLIGGVIVQLGSLKLDASLSGALETLRHDLLAHTA